MSGDDYEVGYAKPPVATRFKPGQSGNPAGRRRGSKNLSTLVDEALCDTVVINVGGRRRKVSKLEAALMQQANKAAAGDAKAMKLMLDVRTAVTRDDAEASATSTTPEQRREQDQLVLQALKARFEGSKP